MRDSIQYGVRLVLLIVALLAVGCDDGSSGAVNADHTDLEGLACNRFAPVGSTVEVVTEGLLCTLLPGVVCSVNNPERAVDGNLTSAANVVYRVGLLDEALNGSAGVRVTLPDVVAPGQLAAFEVALGVGVLDASLGRLLTITTFRNGTVAEMRGSGSFLDLNLLGIDLAGNGSRRLVGFVATEAYDQIQLSFSAELLTLELSTGAQVFELCLGGA